MTHSEQALAHRLRVLRHQQNLAKKAETSAAAESSGQQMSLRLIGEVRRETRLRSTGRKGAPMRTPRQPGLEGL